MLPAIITYTGCGVAPYSFPTIVYKIVSKVNWLKFVDSGNKECHGFNDPKFGNDIKNGYIQLYTHDQLYSVYTKHYSLDEKYRFKLLAIDLDKVESVKWCKLDGVLSPRVYSPLVIGKTIIWAYSMDNYQFGKSGL